MITIGDAAFDQCTHLTSVAIPDSVTFVADYAFANCGNLAHATIGTGVTSMGQGVFEWCTQLTGIYFTGNAPSFDLSVFYGYNNTFIYYLPNATGWSTTYSGRPTVQVLNPQILLDAGFSGSTNCFGFTVTNAGNPVVVIEACTSLANSVWIPVATNTLSGGLSHFSDVQSTNHAARFYRICAP